MTNAFFILAILLGALAYLGAVTVAANIGVAANTKPDAGLMRGIIETAFTVGIGALCAIIGLQISGAWRLLLPAALLFVLAWPVVRRYVAG